MVFLESLYLTDYEYGIYRLAQIHASILHGSKRRQERQPEIQLNSMQLTSLTLELLFHYSLGITHFERLAIFMYRTSRYIIEHGMSRKPIAYRL